MALASDVRREFEVFAWGTSNPWGVDWDERGPGDRDRVRRAAPLARRAGRALRTAGGQPLRPVRLRGHRDDRGPPPLEGARPVGGEPALERARRRARALRGARGPGGRVPGSVARRRADEQHPREPHELRPPRTQGIELRRAPRAGPAPRERPLVPRRRARGRPRRRGLRLGLVRRAGLPPLRSLGLGPYERAHLARRARLAAIPDVRLHDAPERVAHRAAGQPERVRGAPTRGGSSRSAAPIRTPRSSCAR